jgi:hypothetical protein
MNGLFNTVSNAVDSSANTGNSIMANGETVILAVGPYKCSEGTCANSGISGNMLWTEYLNGEVKCVEDNASCVLDGENERRGMRVLGTGSGTLILRAITFDKGYTGYYGGGLYILLGALVDLKLLVFSNNKVEGSFPSFWDDDPDYYLYGGGAIYVIGSGTTVNIYGTSFNGNTVVYEGNGGDIYICEGTITIHNTCPFPYSSITPIQGKAIF